MFIEKKISSLLIFFLNFAVGKLEFKNIILFYLWLGCK